MNPDRDKEKRRCSMWYNRGIGSAMGVCLYVLDNHGVDALVEHIESHRTICDAIARQCDAAATEPESVALSALRQLAGIMDYAPDSEFGCENNCEGCRAEMVEVSRIVREALAHGE